MAYKNQQEFIQALEKAGELVRIKSYVDPKLEIAEITDRISKSGNGGKALLFENTGTDFPVLMNAYGSEKRIGMALGVDQLDDVTREIEALFKLLSAPKEGLLDKLKLLPKLGQFASWMPVVKSGRGECQEVVQTTPDIGKLPVITCWPRDGGPFVTLPIIHTKDPNSGNRNVGMYRMQVFGPTLTGMHWHKHKVSARHFAEYKKTGRKMPVAVALGGDPTYAYSATAPLPENVDEYMLAGFLRKKKVELVKCLTQPEIEVPADADFVIEGYVDPNEELIWEGPFGDHTGYYSLPDWYPRFHVTAITHKKPGISRYHCRHPAARRCLAGKSYRTHFFSADKDDLSAGDRGHGHAGRRCLPQPGDRADPQGICRSGPESDECYVGRRTNDVQQDTGTRR